MKKYVFILPFLLGAFFAQGQASYLDSAFYNNGILIGTPAVGEDRFGQLLHRPDGKVLVMGESSRALRNPDQDGDTFATFFNIAQWLPDGQPDATFGTGGILRMEQKDLRFQAGLVLSDGKLLLAFNRSYFDGTTAQSWVELHRLLPDGAPDAGFGTDGVVTRPELAHCVDLQLIETSSGQVLLGGTATQPNTALSDRSDCFLALLLPNGDLDTQFGNGGITQFDYQNSSNIFKKMDRDPEGRVVVLFDVQFSLSDLSAIVTRFEANGILDTDFANGGFYTRQFYFGSDLLAHPDGRIWATVGKGDETYDLNILDPSGQLVQENNWPGSYHAFNGAPLAIQSDGKVLSAARQVVGNGSPTAEWQIRRFLSSGQLDAGYPVSFSLKREYLTNMAGAKWNMAINSTDRLLLAGMHFDQFWDLDYQWFKLSEAHTPDPAFGQNGFITQNVGTSLSAVSALAQDQQSRVLLLAQGYNGALLRMSPDGAPDLSFANQGALHFGPPALLTLGPPALSAYRFAHTHVLETPDGKIISAGAADANTRQYGLARWQADGQIDPTFGPLQNGYVYISQNSASSDLFGRVAGLGLQPDGKMVLIVSNKNVNVDTSRTWLIRFLPDGIIDATFAQNGVMRGNPGSGFFNIQDAKVLDNGKILVTGLRKTTVNGPGQPYLAQYTAAGAFDPEFGNGGLRLDPFNVAFGFKPQALAMQPDGKILIAGLSGGVTNPKLALGRLLPNGARDNAFSGDGLVTYEAGPGVEALIDVAVQADGRIVGVGKVDVDGDASDITLVRWWPDGTVDSTFGQNGQVITALPGDNEPTRLLIQNNGKYIVGGWDEDRFLAIRYLPDLSVDVEELFSSESLLVYPNPITDGAVLSIHLNRPTELSVDCIDAGGRRVATIQEQGLLEAGAHALPFRLPGDLTAGWYLLRVQTAQGLASVRILVAKR